MKEKTCDKLLKYTFTEGEKRNFSSDMAGAVLTRDSAQMELKSVKSQIDSKIKEAEAKISSMAEKIRSGFEYRYIKCEEIFDYKMGLYTCRRLDDEKLIESRPLTGTERQMVLGEDEEQKEGPQKVET